MIATTLPVRGLVLALCHALCVLFVSHMSRLTYIALLSLRQVFGKWGLGDFGTSGYPLNQGFDTFIGQDSQVACHNW